MARGLIRRFLCTGLAVCLSAGFILPAAAEPDLKTLQQRLLALGYEIGGADGILGSKTSSALMLAQTLLAGSGW